MVGAVIVPIVNLARECKAPFVVDSDDLDEGSLVVDFFHDFITHCLTFDQQVNIRKCLIINEIPPPEIVGRGYLIPLY